MTYFLICNSFSITLLVILILIFAYYVYNLRTNDIFRRLKMPSPPPIPLLGEMFNTMRKGLHANDLELFQKYGKIIGFYEGNSPVVLLSELDLLRNVLIKDSHVFMNRRTIDGVAGVLEHSLITLKDEQWKNVRSLTSPTFSSAKLKIMYVLMNEVSEAYSKRLLEYADKQEMFDIQQLNSEFTLDNIATCLFGIETNSLQHENVTLINYLKKFFSFNISNLLFLLIYISPRLVKYLEERGYSILPKDSVDYTTNVINQILDRRRQRLERRNDFIQMMIDHEEESEQTKEDQHDDHQQSKLLKKTLNDKEILGQAFGFLFAGYETTSVLMSFFFYIMATEPVIQEKVYDEIRQEIGEDEITYEKLNHLHYLDMVISETLRMYPPIFRFERVASADYHLGDYHIPKGMIISVPVYPIHHNADVWTEPEKFIPERFSPAEKAKRHPMAYLPFGDGPRNCLGMRFALLEIKLGIVKALRSIEIQLCEKTEIPIQLSKRPTLSSKNGVWVRVARRVQ